jgi:hypothetical protein
MDMEVVSLPLSEKEPMLARVKLFKEEMKKVKREMVCDT